MPNVIDPRPKPPHIIHIIVEDYINFHLHFRFLEASAHLYSKLPLPTVDEVADYEFRLRVEAEERGEEIEEDDGDGDDNDNDNDNDNDDEQQIEVQANDDGAVQGRCKICFVGQACMASLPCGHMVMCPPCSDRIMLDTQTCPLCRAEMTGSLRVWLG